MDTKPLLVCMTALMVSAVSGCPVGQEFLTTFLTNYKGNGKLELAITAREKSATVKIWSPFFTKTVKVAAGITTRVNLPAKAELRVPGLSKNVVRISSDSSITVVTSNMKRRTGDSAVILPTSNLGRKYVVFTPKPYFSALVAIVNGDRHNVVEILPPANMRVNHGNRWRCGKKTILRLKPYEVFYYMSHRTFTGTRITSTFPLAVLVGDQCAKIQGTCEHVYEQLIPVEMLSDHYLVPSMLKRVGRHWSVKDHAYVVAADYDTTVTFSGKVRKLRAGQSLDIPLGKYQSVAVRSNKKVMVMYFGNNFPHDEFLTNILPTSEMSNSWTLYPQKSYENTAVIVSEAEGSNTISGVTNWRPFPSDKRYVWAMKDLGRDDHPVTISGEALMAVYSIGGKKRHGYGTTGVCSSAFEPTPAPDPCDGITCRVKEECKAGVCVHTSEETCSALGDPHYTTFDGRRYDFQGTCTYTMAEVLKAEAGLVPFTILAKNNHRGNRWVSYVRTVTVTVYNHTVAISGQRGKVEVDGEIAYLPVSLVGGKLQVVQRGRYAILTTNFGLKVSYDWNMMFYITAPSSYFHTLGGLCGNYNGDRKDEWTGRSGSQLSSALEFAKSWKVKDGDLFCHDDCRGKCPSCSAAQKQKFSGAKYCGLITDTKAVFAKCISKVDPDMYFNNCVYDTCINKGITRFLCDNIESYATACMAVGIRTDGWRALANCPMDCPANSHYEACGPACAASCAERDAPSTCKLPCVEGCQCNQGFVLSGDTCVPVASCGCTSNGRYYPAGQTFWADNTCTNKCTCKSGNLKCTATKCKSSEVCSLRNGVRDCYPLSYGTCRGSGDPHYRSFDGKKFDFQGTCTYYLSKLIDTTDPTLEPFEVQVQNENRGRNKAVAYTKTALIKVYGYTIVLSSDNPGRVMLNNVFVNLPLALKDGRLSIIRRGRAGVVKTDFGLEMQFDWRSYVSVTVPSSYSGVLGGLCGNFNGNWKDDMLTPSKTPAKNPTEFGTSWKVKDDPRCKDTCEGKSCPECDINSKQNEPFRKDCSILTDKTGPFKDCHSKVNPEQYYNDCVYDMCMYQGHSSALCNALSTYTSVCQEAQGRIDVWRTETFCPLACKADSHYSVCANGNCFATCQNTEFEICPLTTICREGCVCDDGFVLSDDQCVPEEQCGCEHNGRYYQQGQVFFLGDQCKGRCVCGNDSRVQCQNDFSCGPDEVCRIQDGTEDCFPTTRPTCSVSGTGHYHSFDNRLFSVPGNCVYKMAEVTQDNNGERVPFSVVIHQESAANDPVVTRSVQIEVNGYNFIMHPGRIWEVMLDDIRMNLPLQLDDGNVRVYQNGQSIILQTNFGLEVTYDTISMVRVEIPSSYKGVLLGLCGNYNGNPADDFSLPGGAQASSAETFAESWVTNQTAVTCETACGSQCPTPPPGQQNKARELCDILKDKKGPFSKCHTTVPPQEYFEKCVKDVSEQGGSKDVLCQHLQNYVAVCHESGASVNNWRNAAFCPMQCPKNSQYELCADTCSTTCASLTTPQKCSHCQEGCECEDGFAFDGGECRPLGKCGCGVDGRYYKSGETVMKDDCIEKCTCVNGVFTCEKTSCTMEQVCVVRDGIRNCYQEVEPTPAPDPCDGITCRVKEECKAGVCVHTSEETCSALGDPHYTTFDGRRYDFQGTCTYTMAEVLKAEAGLVPFTILAKNNHRGNRWVSYVRTVTVTVYNHTVAISGQRGKVEVDGEIAYLPVSLVGGKLQVVQRGRYAILTTNFGLKVSYDWNMMFYITAPSSYFHTLGGLCGNYNGDRKDEWTGRSGSQLSSALEFAKSWKVKDGDLFCHDDCRGKCPSCSAAQKQKFSGAKYCGLITDTKAVFAKCISKVDPDMYFNNCVYDTCINKGITRFLCDNIESYATACMAVGIRTDGWRALANCPMDCPANSHYEACGPACAASCAERDAPSTCKLPCVEGCQCNQGFVLSGDTCVPVASCGCTSNGRYYPAGQTFWADNTCTNKCTCKSGNLQCTATKCKSSEVCSLRNGVRDCYPLSYGTCRGSGDPHYRSFDGKKFDFQGTCTYYLSKLIDTTDPTLEPFEVQVQNENRGRNKAVAYTKTALIKVYGYTIVLSSDNPGRVMLNNVFVNLPLALKDGRLSIIRRGRAGVVKTDFGLEMQFDWRSYVSVTVPSSYSGVLGGLCGNFNGNWKDDMLTPSKTPAKNPTEFGTSWKVKDDPRCKDTCEGKSCPECDINSKQNEPFRKDCSILTDKTGPFKDCHSKVNPEQYYKDCVYDMCMYQGHSSALCNALSTYTSVCQEAQGRIDVWRTETFCPLACKADSHYSVCANGNCFATCQNTEFEICPLTTICREGCVCDDGFVLSDDQCVPEEQCGCEHNGRYYQQGQVFFLGDQCKGRCVCGNDSRVQCQNDFSCGPDEVCSIQDGTEDCFPTTRPTCSVSGTGHYHSFDNRLFSVSGNCVYKMAEVTQDNNGERVPFSVVIHQESAANDPVVTRSVQIEVNGYNFIMHPGRIWEVMLDDIRVNLPLQLDDGNVRVYQNGQFIILQTNFGLEVTYDTISTVRVEIPSSYKGVLVGLCGNYNGNPADDFSLPGGAQASSAETFAESWVTNQTAVTCETACGSQCPTPPPGQQNKARELCDILKDKKGPFSKCHTTVPPQEYFEKCVKDVSEQGGSKDVLCQHLQNYVAVCHESGASVNNWRNAAFCPMQCPKNSQYELCADTCSTTCASLTTPQKCSHCQEGCECEDGFAFDGGECRPLGKCGCVVDGRYYKSGETVMKDDCIEKCTCVNGVFTCEKTSCTMEQVCDVRDGIRNCYQEACTEKTVADIVFLVDGSGSIGADNFQRVREFLHTLVDGFDVAPDRVRVGMAQYSSVQRTEFSLNTYQNKQQILEYIDKLSYMRGGTMTGKGLDFILKNHFVESAGSRAKDKVPQIAVVITDGKSSDNVEPYAKSLRDQGITLYAIGVKNADQGQLKQIASAPHDQHVFSVSAFSALQDISQKIVQVLCTDVVKPQPTKVPIVCTEKTVADIVFLVDGSGSIGADNFQRVREFLHTLVDGFDVAPDRVRVGMAQYSSVQRTEFSLNTYQNKQQILEYIDKLSYMRGGTMTGKGLDFILKNHFVESAGSRAKDKVPQIAVVITDGKSSDNVEPYAKSLRDQGITLYAIGVKNADQGQLKQIASAPHDQHVFSVSDFSALQDISQKIVQVLCTDVVKPQPTKVPIVCTEKTVADIVFLVDGSGSIGADNFQRVREFLHTLVDGFDVAPDRVRVGMAQYSSVQRTEFSLNTYQNKQQILEYIDKLSYMRGGTMTGKGLDFILKNHFVESAGSRAKDKVPQIAVVITDGKSSDNVEPYAKSLRDQGITLYAIGVKNADQGQLKQIASAPHDQHVFSVSAFSALQDISQKIVQVLCTDVVKPQPTKVPIVCTEKTVADIVFLVDGSGSIGADNFQRVREFLHTLVDGFDVAPDRVRVGMAQYSSVQRTEFNLNTYQNKQQILEYIDKLSYMRGGTKTGKGLDFILKNHFVESAGSRAKDKVPQIAVVITDGKSSDNVEPYAKSLRDQGITLYAIGVKNADQGQLKQIASAPHDQHVFSVSDFSALKGISQKIVQVLCTDAEKTQPKTNQ